MPGRAWENSSNASPGPTGNPSGSDCAHGGGTGWPTDSGISGLAPLGSNQEATVCRSVGPPASSKRPRLSPCRKPVSAPAVPSPAGPSRRQPTPTFAGSAVAGSWADCSRECRSLFKNVCRKRREQVAVDALRVAKPNLDLGRMDVDVDLLGRNLEVEKRHGHPADHQQAAIGFVERVRQRAVTHVAARDEEELPLRCRPAL